jgi:hypothetical protein
LVSANLVEIAGGSPGVTTGKAATVRESIATHESKYRTIGKTSVINLTI